MTKSACFCLLYPFLGNKQLRKKRPELCAKKNGANMRKKMQICATIRKSGFVHFLQLWPFTSYNWL